MPDNSEKPARQRADGYAILYINASLMGFSPWDIQITFSTGSGLGGTQHIEDQVTVIQSPSHAKAMLHSLERTIANYEAQFGAIPDLSKQTVSEIKSARPKRAQRRLASPKQEN